MPTMSRHARSRMQQRAISEKTVAATLLSGRQIHQRGGYIVHYLGRKEVSLARNEGKNLAPHCNTAVVVAGDGTVVTVMHAPGPRSFIRRAG